MEKFDDKYMSMAKIWATNSYAIRNKVGALIVKNNTIISDGFNGTPKGFDNRCETSRCTNHKVNEDTCEDRKNNKDACYSCIYGELTTKPIVIHAEANAITKLAKGTQSSDGATLYVTLSPCCECAKLIIQSGIKRVVYEQVYRNTEGLEILKKAGIEVEQLIQ